MRIGEILIISPDANDKRRFIESICNKTEVTSSGFTFGRLPINEQLILHLYGVTIKQDIKPFTWDLIAEKILGCVVLFSWDDLQTFEKVVAIVDQVTNRHQTAVIVAAQAQKKVAPLFLYKDSIALSSKGKFTLCDIEKPQSVKRVLIDLIDLLILQTE